MERTTTTSMPTAEVVDPPPEAVRTWYLAVADDTALHGVAAAAAAVPVDESQATNNAAETVAVPSALGALRFHVAKRAHDADLANGQLISCMPSNANVAQRRAPTWTIRLHGGRHVLVCDHRHVAHLVASPDKFEWLEAHIHTLVREETARGAVRQARTWLAPEHVMRGDYVAVDVMHTSRVFVQRLHARSTWPWARIETAQRGVERAWRLLGGLGVSDAHDFHLRAPVLRVRCEGKRATSADVTLYAHVFETLRRDAHLAMNGLRLQIDTLEYIVAESEPAHVSVAHGHPPVPSRLQLVFALIADVAVPGGDVAAVRSVSIGEIYARFVAHNAVGARRGVPYDIDTDSRSADACSAWSLLHATIVSLSRQEGPLVYVMQNPTTSRLGSVGGLGVQSATFSPATGISVSLTQRGLEAAKVRRAQLEGTAQRIATQLAITFDHDTLCDPEALADATCRWCATMAVVKNDHVVRACDLNTPASVCIQQTQAARRMASALDWLVATGGALDVRDASRSYYDHLHTRAHGNDASSTYRNPLGDVPGYVWERVDDVSAALHSAGVLELCSTSHHAFDPSADLIDQLPVTSLDGLLVRLYEPTPEERAETNISPDQTSRNERALVRSDEQQTFPAVAQHKA